MSIAIVGSGIAGLAAAHALAKTHDVVMYEAAARAGGHVYTVEVGNGVAVDMGFIVHNRERYPHFTALLAELAIETRPTTMAFSVCADGTEWGSASLAAMFADRRALASPRHWRFLAGVVRLLRHARRDLAATTGSSPLARASLDDVALHERSRDLRERCASPLARASLDDYLAMREVSRDVRERFVVPLAAALWSLAPDHCGEFPALTYFGFLDQHGMLSPVRPLAWRTIVGGSQRYVTALLARLQATSRFTLALSSPVSAIRRAADRVALTVDGRELVHDRVVVATHADTALALLTDVDAEERTALGAFRYSRNRTVLHTDRSFLPRRTAAHASWNYVADPDTARVAVTYSMTRLQGLPDVPYLVTLNPRREPTGVLHEIWLDHPQLDLAALAAQSAVLELGARRTYFAGAHLGFGFHEDGMRTGLAAAARVLADARRG